MRSNEAAHEAMRDTGHLAVHWAAHRAVSGFVPWAMIWAMDMTVYGAASAAVDEVMHRAVRTDPSHPSRVAFLALVGGKDAA
jgi:hypothetical protein